MDYETKLLDYRSAVEKGLAFYITAELKPSFLNSRKPFIVGDGNIYNRYENAPLEAASCKVYQRSVSRVLKVYIENMLHCTCVNLMLLLCYNIIMTIIHFL